MLQMEKGYVPSEIHTLKPDWFVLTDGTAATDAAATAADPLEKLKYLSTMRPLVAVKRLQHNRKR